MEKVLIMALFIFGPMILKAIKKKNQEAKRVERRPADSGKSIADELGDLFEVFEERAPEVSIPREVHNPNVQRDFTQEDQRFYSEIVEDSEPEIVEVVPEREARVKTPKKSVVSQAKKKKQYRNFFDKIEKYSYIEKGMIYKEVLGKPISMR